MTLLLANLFTRGVQARMIPFDKNIQIRNDVAHGGNSLKSVETVEGATSVECV